MPFLVRRDRPALLPRNGASGSGDVRARIVYGARADGAIHEARTVRGVCAGGVRYRALRAHGAAHAGFLPPVCAAVRDAWRRRVRHGRADALRPLAGDVFLRVRRNRLRSSRGDRPAGLSARQRRLVRRLLQPPRQGHRSLAERPARRAQPERLVRAGHARAKTRALGRGRRSAGHPGARRSGGSGLRRQRASVRRAADPAACAAAGREGRPAGADHIKLSVFPHAPAR